MKPAREFFDLEWDKLTRTGMAWEFYPGGKKEYTTRWMMRLPLFHHSKLERERMTLRKEKNVATDDSGEAVAE